MSNPQVFLDLSIDGGDSQRVTIELFTNVVPKTCENFQALCNGFDDKLNYKGTEFHRLVSGGWLEGGKLPNVGEGEARSIFGESFPDESFSVCFDEPGILAMTNSGAHSNGSQFFITLAAHEWLNTKSVAFGKVVEGFDTLKSITSGPSEIPDQKVTVVGCGSL